MTCTLRIPRLAASARLAAPLTLTALITGILTTGASAQSFGADFAADYTYTDLGSVPGVPTPLGGIVFKEGDPNTILIGGAANTTSGAIYEIGVTRDVNGHVTGFVGTAALHATAANIDGGLVYAQNGTLLFTAYSNNHLGQILPGSSSVDKWIDLTPLGITSSVGTCRFVPSGFLESGKFKVASYNSSDWYDVTLVPDGAGTFDISAVNHITTLAGGPEGVVYIDGSNPGFTSQSILLTEYIAGAVGAYELNSAGEPDLSTRRDFMVGLSGAEGAVTDPLSGDFLFSTFGGGNRVLVIHGFDAPHTYCAGRVASTGCEPTMLFAGSPTLTGPDDFVLSCANAPNNVFGVMVWSLVPDSAPFYGGTLCVNLPAFRRPVQRSGGSPGGSATDCSGTFSDHLDQAFFVAQGLTPGTTVYCQYIGRDPGFGPPSEVMTSEGLAFTVLQ